MSNQSTSDKIRDAAVTLFAEHGFKPTTVRAIAAAAEVSPGLVIHHFGSKDKLQAACDAYIAEVIREGKELSAEAGISLDPMAALKNAQAGPPTTKYLARALAENSPGAAALYDQLLEDSVGYMEVMVETGIFLPSDNPYGRSAVLMAWTLGAVVLHEHVKRTLDVDLLAPPDDPLAGAAYIGPTLELLQGVLTPQIVEMMQSMFVAPGAESGSSDDELRKDES